MRLESLQQVALAVAEERSLDAILNRLVQGLVGEGLALARVWLLDAGDICETCPLRAECRDRTRCLHLVASAGRSLDGREDWSRLTGDFQRIPLNARKVGYIGATGSSVFLQDIGSEQQWTPRPEWVARESIRSFAGHPLIFRGESLGVLGVFSRTALDETAFEWLKMFANQAAASIANARAFSEIERLHEQLELENAYLREEVKVALAPNQLIGRSPGLQRVLKQIDLVAPTDATVLITGESGTGKELIARRIHELSLRRHRPLIKVNCASIPRDLFESEFFGHVRGAFTGAVRDRAGRFQAAESGTLFLDEIGEIPLELQGKLLRAIQDGQFERVGEDRTRRVDVRIVAATNRDLRQAIADDRFRQDLYFRLSVFPIELPPLRDRSEDIPKLAEHFVKTAAMRLKVPTPVLTGHHLDALKEYAWPGNVRELQNVLERAVILARGGPLPLEFLVPLATPQVDRTRERPRALEAESAVLTEREVRERERKNLLSALTQTAWRIYGPNGAAALLGVRPTTLVSRMKAMRIQRPKTL